MLFSICSQAENVKDPRVSSVNLWGQVITLRGQILVSRTDDVTLCVVRLCVVRLCVVQYVCVVGVHYVWVCVLVLVLVLVSVCRPAAPTPLPVCTFKTPPVCTGTTPASDTTCWRVVPVHTGTF